MVLEAVGDQAKTHRILDVRPGLTDEGDPLWAAAVDIGTTTVSFWLVDLVKGKVKAHAAEYNGQIARGEDVISRIVYASKNGGGEELQRQVASTINKLSDTACKRAHTKPREIIKASVAGNSTMIHLLMGLPASSIRLSPFITTVNQPPPSTSREIGLNFAPDALIDCLPGVASYVGGDIVGVRLEGDFNGGNIFQSENYTNSVLFRLRHAYRTFGGLLAGMTWSTFLDLGAAPDTVDFNGPGSLALVRNPMIRYTFTFSPGATLALALENTRGQQYGSDARFQVVPDVHANFVYSGSWGQLSLRGVAQDFVRQVAPAGPGSETNKSKWGLSGALSGSAKLGGDTLVAQVSGGQSIGRYLFNMVGSESATGVTPGFVTIDASNEIQLWTAYAYHLGFPHVWSAGLRSNLVWSQTFIQDAEIDGVPADNAVQKEMMQAFVNTFWGFAKNCELGVEYVYGQWKSFSTPTSPELKGTQNRVSFSFHYNFF